MNQVMKKRLVGASVLVLAVLIFGLLFFRGSGTPMGPSIQPSDLADVRSYAIEVPTVPEQPPQEILAQGPPIGTLLPVPEPEPEKAAEKKKPAEKPKPAKPAPPAPVESGPMVPSEGWSVQVGSFSSRENADRRQKWLKEKGYPAFVYRNAAENPPLFRVRVGPYMQQDEAKASAQRLRDELRVDVMVVSNG